MKPLAPDATSGCTGIGKGQTLGGGVSGEETVLEGASAGATGSGAGCANSVIWSSRSALGPIGMAQQSIGALQAQHVAGRESMLASWTTWTAARRGPSPAGPQTSGRAYGSARATMIMAAAPNRLLIESNLASELKLPNDSKLGTRASCPTGLAAANAVPTRGG